MTIKTYTEQLEDVQAAIEAVVNKGQSYTIGDRTYTRADLDDLTKYEKYLRRQVNLEKRGGSFKVKRITPL